MSATEQPTLFAAGAPLSAAPSPAGGSDTGAVCIPNISTRERQKRLIFGLIQFGLGLAILAVLLAFGANRWWRLPLFLVWFGAANGFFQWRDKTCVGLSALGSRQIGEQREKIEDPAELAQVRRQAQAVQRKAFLAAVPLTLLVVALPPWLRRRGSVIKY
jgi:hypothetical protein